MTQSAIIFDFDGVLADSEESAYRILKRVAEKKRVPTPSIEFVKTHDTQQVLNYLKMKWWELPYYTALTRKWLQETEPAIKMFPWATRMMNLAQSQSHHVWIVSSNSPTMIARTFASHGIEFDLDRIYGNVGIFGKSRELKKLIRKQRLNRKNVVYVGDETRDIKAAHSAGIQCLSVSWGYHAETLLSSMRPDFLARDFHEFETAIQSLKYSQWA